ncbi:hypothetical protein L4C36_18370 [Photobacterium japonica]|uniref:glycoside hydrolase family protein n=1 Tax=Photobacterium japonica TaxID=2910235 RepID=UPI003D125789
MSKLKIAKSVGIGGINNYLDIKAVQISLNKLRVQLSPMKKLDDDGSLGRKPENSKTVEAIKIFQKKILGMPRPDGRIDVNGRTHRKINEKLNQLNVATPIVGELKTTLRRMIEENEGRIPHMYLCTEGKVTVGVGHMMASVSAAQKVPFVVRGTGVPATKKQIEDEFNVIKARPYGKSMPHHKFKAFTVLELSSATMSTQIDNHIKSFERELKLIYGANEFGSYPDNVKLALFDMIFNLGMPTLKSGFPSFNKHIKAGDYEKAALECNRYQVSIKRNDFVRSLLRSAK